MNTQHKLNKAGNRLRRLSRRLTELESDKSHEINLAEENKREPNLSGILAAMTRLTNRQRELLALPIPGERRS